MRIGTVLAGAALVALAFGLAGCTGRSAQDLPDPDGLAQETTQTSVFYSTGRSLVEEYKVVDANDVYAATLRELLRAMPEEKTEIAIVQPTAEFKSVTLEDGVLTIDWTAEVLDFEAEDREKALALAAFLRTFGEFPEIEKVRFTVEGRTDGEIGGKDVEAFWGRVSLNGQPWDVLRPQTPPGASEGAETTAGADSPSDEADE